MNGGFTPAQRAAVLLVGVVGVLIPGLQPQLLGALAVEGGVSESLLGHVATAELLAMGIAAGGAGLIVSRMPLRAVAAVAIAACVALDLLTMGLRGGELIAARTAAGLAEGVLIWIAIGLIVRSAEPARWSGIYLMVQTLAQLAVAIVLGLAVIPAWGSAGGFATLGGVTALALIALPWLPASYSPLVRDTEAAAVPLPWRSVPALGGVLLYLAFVVAVWVYVEPLARERGIDPASIALIAPLSLAMQVVGAACATLLATRLSALPTLLFAGMANLMLLTIMGTSGSATAFLLATSAFGFLWLFAMPFQIPVVIAADPSRRAASLIGGAQLVGASAGPFVAALMLSGSVLPVLWFGAGCIVVAMLSFALAAARRRAA